MAITVVTPLCKITSGQTCEVVLESPSIEELTSREARQAAIEKAASLGMPRAGISTQEGTYPIDADGHSDEDLIMGRRQGIAAYRQLFKLAQAI